VYERELVSVCTCLRVGVCGEREGGMEGWERKVGGGGAHTHMHTHA